LASAVRTCIVRRLCSIGRRPGNAGEYRWGERKRFVLVAVTLVAIGRRTRRRAAVAVLGSAPAFARKIAAAAVIAARVTARLLR
jgi:hypothetical protein